MDEANGPRYVQLLRRRGMVDVVFVAALDQSSDLPELLIALRERPVRCPVVIELGHRGDVDGACVARLLAAVADIPEPELALVCRSPALLANLSAAGTDRLVALFASVGDALQAQVLKIAGYGDGWMSRRPRA